MISVIIPAYNAVQCIGRAINSVLGQSYSDREIIVIDDGSTDNTAKVVRQYGDKVHYIHQENAGAGVARNTGLAAAKGDWIAFLDADDEWLPDKLKKQMELLARNPELLWCAANFTQTDGLRSAPHISVAAIKTALGARDYIEDFFVEAGKGRCHIATPTVVVHKSVFEEAGGFEPGRAAGEDMDMWWRIAYRYPKIGYIAEPMATVYLDVDNIVFTRRRLLTKRGANARELITRHLQLAREQDRLDSFRPYAKKLLRKSVITAIYHGFKADSRTTVKQFSDLFPWYWRIGTYILTIFPKVTSSILRGVAYARYRLGFERQVTRRWTYQRTDER